MKIPIKLEDLVQGIKETLNKNSSIVINIIYENENDPSVNILKKRLDSNDIPYVYTKKINYLALTEIETSSKQTYEIDINQINLIN